MNNKYFFSALCLITLACVPACKQKHTATSEKKEVIETMIELDNTVVETENKNSILKF